MSGEENVFDLFGKKFRGLKMPDGSVRMEEISVCDAAGKEGSTSSEISVAPGQMRKRKLAGDDDDVEDDGVDDVEEDADEVDGDDDDDNDADDDGCVVAVTNGGSKPKKSRVTWNDAETKKFLEICQDKHVSDKIDGKIGQNLTKKQIFFSVSKELKCSHLSKREKTWEHCKEKYGKMKKLYKETMRKNNKSGEGRATCKFFEELHSLFHKRPIVTCHANGYDRVVNTISSTEESSSPFEVRAVDDDTPPPPLQQQPARYRSVSTKSVSNAMLIEQILKRDDERDAADRQWMEMHTEKQSELDEQVLIRVSDKFTSNLNAGMERFAHVIANAMMPQAHSSSTNFNHYRSDPQPMQQPFNSPSPTTFTQLTPPMQPPMTPMKSPVLSVQCTPVRPKSSANTFVTTPVSINRGPVLTTPERPAASPSGRKVISIPATTLSSLQRMGNVKIIQQKKH